MATFPGGIPTFTNPTSGDDLDTEVGGLTHSGQHGAVNDEIEAIAAELGTNPSAGFSTVGARFTAVESDVSDLAADVAALPGGDTRVFDAVAYGALVDGSTDDTTAWQDAIDACATAGGGVVTSSKNGVSVIAGALQDTSAANAQLLLPSIHVTSGEQITVAVRGLNAPPADVSVIGSMVLPDNHLVLKSTLSSGTGAVIGVKGPSGSPSGFSNIHADVGFLSLRMPSNPTNSGLDLRYAATANVEEFVADVGTYDASAVTEPTTTTSYAVRLPTNNNGARTTARNVNVVGFYNGVEHSEHAVLNNVNAWGCKVAFVPTAANHASTYLRAGAYHCERVIKPAAAHSLDAWQLNVEHAASGWMQTDYDIDDSSNYLTGFVRWWSVLAGTGPHNSFTKNGASNVTSSRVGSALGSGSGSLSVQDENGTAMTGVTQLDFQGPGVAATSGTGEVVVTIGDYTYRDRVVASAGNDTLTLGATPITNAHQVWVNGTIKLPTTDYTIAANVITFGSALSASDVVAVMYRTTNASYTAATLSTFGAISYADNFNRTNSSSSLGVTSTGGLTWTQWRGTWGIDTNKAYVSNGDASTTNYAVVDSGVANVTVSAVITVGIGNPNAGIIVRGGATVSDFFLVEIAIGTAYTPKIYKVAGGAVTTVATGSSITFATGDTLSVVVTATTITAKRNGSTIVSVTDSTHNTNTKQGIYATATASTASVARHDDLSITN